MALDPAALPQEVLAFLVERHLATLTTLRPDGSPRAVVAQVDGPRWLALEGVPTVCDDPDRVAEAVRRYAGRYRQPQENPQRVVVEIAVDRVLGRG